MRRMWIAAVGVALGLLVAGSWTTGGWAQAPAPGREQPQAAGPSSPGMLGPGMMMGRSMMGPMAMGSGDTTQMMQACVQAMNQMTSRATPSAPSQPTEK